MRRLADRQMREIPAARRLLEVRCYGPASRQGRLVAVAADDGKGGWSLTAGLSTLDDGLVACRDHRGGHAVDMAKVREQVDLKRHLPARYRTVDVRSVADTIES